MKEKRALQRIREEFQRFPLEGPTKLSSRWIFMPHEKNDLLEHALLYLCDWMKIDRAAVFLYDAVREALIARQLVDEKDVLQGEEEIALMPNSSLKRMLEGKKPYLIVNEPNYMAYIPLRAFGNIFGVLRVENVRRKQAFTEQDIPLLQDFSHELATALRGFEMATVEREQVAQMQALHEISNAIFRSVRLDEMLKSVAQSLIQQLGFDRVKIYLINREGEILESALTMDQRQQEAVEKESFPLKRGVHPMVDLILGKTGDERIEKYQRTILYLPLRTRDENMGVLMVDNLLSQQEIPSRISSPDSRRRWPGKWAWPLKTPAYSRVSRNCPSPTVSPVST